MLDDLGFKRYGLLKVKSVPDSEIAMLICRPEESTINSLQEKKYKTINSTNSVGNIATSIKFGDFL